MFQKKPAVSLIELIITVAIVIGLVGAAAPNLSRFSKSASYHGKVSEIETMVNNISALARNPQIGQTEYRLMINNGILYVDPPPPNNKNVVMEKDQTVSSGVQSGGVILRCYVPGNTCVTGGGTTISDQYTDIVQFTDNNFATVRTKTFGVKNNPFKVRVQ
ncbi:MAG: hypothetical protein BWY68_00495 [bacterium ADurb.Bin400]|nr:MAG: hypothetical protein BWY68_00495 [bacterium ADurb.Bin400]